jgi:hypothetical protein
LSTEEYKRILEYLKTSRQVVDMMFGMIEDMIEEKLKEVLH